MKAYRGDFIAQMELGNTWSLEEALSGDYDGVYIADGHGALWDISTDPHIGKLLYRCLIDETPVAMVGHGVAALATLYKLRQQDMQGLRVTCFTDTEEALLKRHHEVPFSLKEQLTGFGADVNQAIIPFSPHMEVDGIFITGQNPASSAMTARALTGRLELAHAN
ncbi:hypothetical protein H8S90_13920 [Olivibacter sp. SDN3]|uniref:hypothetical protein n=1 Tax=Olivibacter sp. SDN3 TaxID=2764720 RepID=UPI0016513687|nr:hypothetical protein [Olivibacter sp. SDN3]QNL47916.1 hypothetical protein H8S90_13920 [Olivibacter sp. SDN3]